MEICSMNYVHIYTHSHIHICEYIYILRNIYISIYIFIYVIYLYFYIYNNILYIYILRKFNCIFTNYYSNRIVLVIVYIIVHMWTCNVQYFCISIIYIYITVSEPRNPSYNFLFVSSMTEIIEMILMCNLYYVFYVRNHENYLSECVLFF